MSSTEIAQRVHAAKARIGSLNPLVVIETIARSDIMQEEGLWAIVQAVDLVCMTDSTRESLVSLLFPFPVDRHCLSCPCSYE